MQHKTAFVLEHKLREAITAGTRDVHLEGEVEVDGAVCGGYVRPANLREQRIDRRRLDNRSGKRRVVVVLRQRSGRALTRTFLQEGEGMGLTCRSVVDFGLCRRPDGAQFSGYTPAAWAFSR